MKSSILCTDFFDIPGGAGFQPSTVSLKLYFDCSIECLIRCSVVRTNEDTGTTLKMRWSPPLDTHPRRVRAVCWRLKSFSNPYLRDLIQNLLEVPCNFIWNLPLPKTFLRTWNLLYLQFAGSFVGNFPRTLPGTCSRNLRNSAVRYP